MFLEKLLAKLKKDGSKVLWSSPSAVVVVLRDNRIVHSVERWKFFGALHPLPSNSQLLRFFVPSL